MYQNLEKIIKIEWKAQELQQRIKKSGPSIEPLITISQDDIHTAKESLKPSNYLFIQGSFDPPTLSHLELISLAINLQSNIDPMDSINVVILLSLSHVDKKFSVLKRSLLGYRVEMLEALFKHLEFKIPITIGLSNVSRYIDLIKATHQTFNNIKKLSFIMGMDVFKKLLDPFYYSQALENVLPIIFKANYHIAGREDVLSKKQFTTFLNDNLPEIYHDKIHFLSLPKEHQFLNSTTIREIYSEKQPVPEMSIHPAIEKYLTKNNLYRSTSKWLATKIAIQLITKLTLEAGKSQKYAIKTFKHFFSEIERDTEIQQKMINEYKTEENVEISKRWQTLKKLIS